MGDDINMSILKEIETKIENLVEQKRAMQQEIDALQAQVRFLAVVEAPQWLNKVESQVETETKIIDMNEDVVREFDVLYSEGDI